MNDPYFAQMFPRGNFQCQIKPGRGKSICEKNSSAAAEVRHKWTGSATAPVQGLIIWPSNDSGLTSSKGKRILSRSLTIITKRAGLTCYWRGEKSRNGIYLSCKTQRLQTQDVERKSVFVSRGSAVPTPWLPAECDHTTGLVLTGAAGRNTKSHAEYQDNNQFCSPVKTQVRRTDQHNASPVGCGTANLWKRQNWQGIHRVLQPGNHQFCVTSSLATPLLRLPLSSPSTEKARLVILETGKATGQSAAK